MINEIASKSKCVDGFYVGSGKADQTSSAIDVEGCLNVTVLCGAAAYTDTTWDFEIDECDTSDGTFTKATDVVGAFAVTSESSAAQTGTMAYTGYKRYIKVVAKAGGTKSTGSSVKTMVLLGDVRHCPQ